MALFIWDASALAKRYTAETGRDIANYLFANVPATDMTSTPWGYAEKRTPFCCDGSTAAF